jgi:N-acetylglutamate synthase-like GNAT family acetyltransferase
LAEYIIKPAVKEDSATIRAMVRQARINPTGLDWRRFLIAQTPEGVTVGCGQVKLHNDGSRELASIVVDPGFRGLGIARAVIMQLVARSEMPLYLMCRSNLGEFYRKFDFRLMKPDEMPPYFKRINSLVGIFSKFQKDGDSLLVMRRD